MKWTPINILILTVIGFITGIAVMGIFGHIFNHQKWYSWTPNAAMSVNTATEFILVSLVLFLVIIDKKEE